MVARPDSPLQRVAKRIIARHLLSGDAREVQIVPRVGSGRGVDIIYAEGSRTPRSAKVKADSYCGVDERKIADRSLPFYRADTKLLAFETLASASTREPGWAVESEADDLYYYYVALAQTEEDVLALLLLDNEEFFSRLRVECDELIVLPMAETRTWFEEHGKEYAPRPINTGLTSAWCRLIPREVVRTEIPGTRIEGSIFGGLLP